MENQHFSQIQNWQSPIDTHTIDCLKISLANKQGLSVIRLYQPEVLSSSFVLDLSLFHVYNEPSLILYSEKMAERWNSINQ